MPFQWTANTTPFFEQPDVLPARFVLEQVADDEFRLQASFCYVPPGDQRPINVTQKSLGDTDLASIPRFMSWFVSRHGRHTPAALVHDQLVTSHMPLADRALADRTFLEAMDCLEVPPVRSRVMWAAVSLATRCTNRPWGLLGIIAWAILGALGTLVLVLGLVRFSPLLIVVALLAPLAGAALWGRHYWAGVIGGYSLWVVATPAIASLAGYGAYWLVERAVRNIRNLLPQNKDVELPKPVGFSEK
jgi:Protein of unknown function (DUF1353)